MTVKKKKSKKWLIGLVLLLVVFVGVLAVPRLLPANPSVAASQNILTAAARTGSIEKTVTGTGNLTSDDTFEDMNIPNNITISDVVVEVGDTVKKGDKVADLDPIVLEQAIYDTQDAIDSLDAELSAAKEQTESQYISSSISGRVKQILVEDGDDVAQTMTEKGALIILSIDGKMAVSFVPSETDGLAEGDDVTVTLSDGTEKEGTIASISAGTCKVTVSDNGPAVSDSVVVTDDDGTKLGSGMLTINYPLEISGTNGKVADVLLALDDYVYENTNVIELEDAAVSRDYQQLYEDRTAKKEILVTLLKYKETNSITAAFDGTIESVNISDGQSSGDSSSTGDSSSSGDSTSSQTGSSASAGTSSALTDTSAAAATSSSASSDTMTALTIKTGRVMILETQIDELDILSLAIGQKAEITLDALPSQSFEGLITEISDQGTVSQGVTTYAVTLSVTPHDSMRVGMNVSAVITIDKRDNVILIPLEALQESGSEQFVYVGTASGEFLLGEKQIVTTGISDGVSVEITSGLTDSENINYIYISDTEDAAAALPFGGGKMMGGGSSTGNPITQAGQ